MEEISPIFKKKAEIIVYILPLSKELATPMFVLSQTLTDIIYKNTLFQIERVIYYYSWLYDESSIIIFILHTFTNVLLILVEVKKV